MCSALIEYEGLRLGIESQEYLSSPFRKPQVADMRGIQHGIQSASYLRYPSLGEHEVK